MKIVVTGSLGHISKPLAEELVEKGHDVTVISSKPERKDAIEALGAKAAIGTVEDVDFLTAAFKGADAVYTMIPPGNFTDPDLDIKEQVHQLIGNYVQAINQSGVKRLVQLSSIGAHTDEGNGILGIYYVLEGMLNALPSDVAITFMRPVGFYYNLLSFISMIKTRGVITTNYGGDDKKPWVSTKDIAAAVAEEITKSKPESRNVRYVASEEISGDEIASILGADINKPELKWVAIPDEQLLKGMIDTGMNPQIARGFVEMNASIRSGVLFEDYYRNRPTLGNVKMTDFAKDFAAVYNQ